MARKCAWIIAVMFAAFLGGMCSEWMQSRGARAADESVAAKAKAAPAAQTLTVGKLVLVDADGKERAVLSADGEKTQLSIYDDKGQKRVIVGQFPVQDDIPYWGIMALDPAGKRRYASGVQADGSGAGLGIYSPRKRSATAWASCPTATAARL